MCYRARRYDDAIRAARQALEFDAALVNALWWEGMSYAGERDYPRSIASLMTAVRMSGNPIMNAMLGNVCGLAGQRNDALRLVKEHSRLAKQRYVSPMDFEVVYAGLGDADQAFHWLDLSHKARSPRVHELTFAYFDQLRSDTRYREFATQVGLPI